jgi:hypothetical protein
MFSWHLSFHSLHFIRIQLQIWISCCLFHEHSTSGMWSSLCLCLSLSLSLSLSKSIHWTSDSSYLQSVNIPT